MGFNSGFTGLNNLSCSTRGCKQ